MLINLWMLLSAGDIKTQEKSEGEQDNIASIPWNIIKLNKQAFLKCISCLDKSNVAALKFFSRVVSAEHRAPQMYRIAWILFLHETSEEQKVESSFFIRPLFSLFRWLQYDDGEEIHLGKFLAVLHFLKITKFALAMNSVEIICGSMPSKTKNAKGKTAQYLQMLSFVEA